MPHVLGFIHREVLDLAASVHVDVLSHQFAETAATVPAQFGQEGLGHVGEDAHLLVLLGGEEPDQQVHEGAVVGRQDVWRQLLLLLRLIFVK